MKNKNYDKLIYGKLNSHFPRLNKLVVNTKMKKRKKRKVKQ